MAYETIATQLAAALGVSPWIVIFVMIWAVAWKGWALWISARKNSPIWFVALLVINTLGIFEILYIFIFSKMGQKKEVKARPRRR